MILLITSLVAMVANFDVGRLETARDKWMAMVVFIGLNSTSKPLHPAQ